MTIEGKKPLRNAKVDTIDEGVHTSYVERDLNQEAVEMPYAQIEDTDMVSIEIPYADRNLFADYQRDKEKFRKFMDAWGATSDADQDIVKRILNTIDSGQLTREELETLIALREKTALVIFKGSELANRFEDFTMIWESSSEESRRAFIDMVDSGGTVTNDELALLARIRNGEAMVIDTDALSLDRGEKTVMFLGSDGFSKLIAEQQQWSLNTFGPMPRTAGILDHITKELGEIEKEPYDLMEWVDTAILAIDGFWRHGGNPLMFTEIYERKIRKNFARVWPDWRTLSADKAIEHDRSKD